MEHEHIASRDRTLLGARSPARAGAVPSIVNEVLRAPGHPLDARTRQAMESHLGHDFSRVRVHTDDRAAVSARAVGALAYTVGQSIVFGRGRYAPQVRAGRELLAHELVHTIQQASVDFVPARDPLGISPPSDAGEREAHVAAAAVAPAGRQVHGRGLRARLGSVSRLGHAVLQRAVTTWGGDWTTDHYEAVQNKDAGGNPVPAAQGMRGADITLRFKPSNSLNAELIGLSQSVQSYVSNALSLTPAAATRAIPAADAKPINTGPGETDEGTAIDMAQGYNSPIYPVQSTASTSLDDNNTLASWGQNGWHYRDAAKNLKHQDATLTDTPRRAGAQKNSRQIFEVASLVTKGAQKGDFLGSVRWGWRTDNAGSLSKIDVQKVSDGMPSSAFIKAAGIWDKGHSSTGAANVKLGMPSIQITTFPVTLQPQAVVMLPIKLPIGTRVKIVSGFALPYQRNTGTVEVVDGPYVGVVGDIAEPLLPMDVLAAERP